MDQRVLELTETETERSVGREGMIRSGNCDLPAGG